MNTMKWKFIPTILVLVYAGSGNAGTANVFLDKPVSAVTFDGAQVRSVCEALNKPCGIELKRCRDFQGKGEVIRLEKVTLRKVLEQTVQSHPDYRWSIRDEIVNLEPIKRIGPDLLSRRIEKISIHGISAFDAFHLVLSSAGIRGQGSAIFGSGLPAQGLIDLELKEATVRDALNAIAKLDGEVVWSFCSDRPEQSLGSLGLIGWGVPQIKDGAKKIKGRK